MKKFKKEFQVVIPRGFWRGTQRLIDGSKVPKPLFADETAPAIDKAILGFDGLLHNGFSTFLTRSLRTPPA